MTTDNIMYLAYGAVAVIAVVFPFINIMVRRLRPCKGQNTGRPSFSVIIPAHDNARELERHLPCLLKQQYDGDFEVIVVVSKTDDRTDEVLAAYSGDSRLYSTFIPSTSRYMSRKKLAMTVGAKAAKYEWLVFADAECYPKGSMWLDSVAREIGERSEIALGYGNYNGETSHFHRFIHLEHSLYALRIAAGGRAHMAPSDWLAIKRDLFMEAKGFEGNLMYVRGEYDYLVNKFAVKGNTAVVTDPDGWMMCDEPTKKSWKNNSLFRIDTMKHLNNRFSYAIAPAIDQITMYAAYIIIIAAIVWGLLTSDMLLTVISALSLLINIAIRTLIARKTLTMYGEDIPIWKVVPMETFILLHNIKYRIKYRFSDKLDFISHKL